MPDTVCPASESWPVMETSFSMIYITFLASLAAKETKEILRQTFFFPSLIKKYARIICALRPLTLSACNVAMKM
jgi:hypothetical protein